jgi:hypothetical protein
MGKSEDKSDYKPEVKSRESKSDQFSTIVRIYGVPIPDTHDKELGTPIESSETYPYYGILYCGFRAGTSDIRQPTDRLWYIKKSDVEKTGIIEDFVWNEKKVNYYDIDGGANILEKRYEPVHLTDEVSVKPRIFAQSVAVTPSNSGIDTSDIANMTREELENLIAGNIESLSDLSRMAPPGLSWGGKKPPKVDTGCKTWRQTYVSTRYDPFVRSDPWGADCEDQ